MSRKSCGVLERNCVVTRLRPGTFCSFWIRPSVCCCKATRPRSPRSSTMNLNPPAMPRPGIGDAPSTVNWASGTFSAQALLRLFMIAVSRSSGFCRWSKGARTMNIEAKLELFACNRNELPAKATVCAMPGVSRSRDLLDLGDDRFGSLQRRRVGQLDVGDQPALVLLRNESGRRPLKRPVGQCQQTAIDHQHDHADAQQSADGRSIARGHPVEVVVELPKQPAEHAVHAADDQPTDGAAGHAAGNKENSRQDPRQPRRSAGRASAAPAAGRPK